jgi:hypothetical protein
MDAEFLSDFGTVPGEVQRSERVQVRLGWLDFLLGQAYRSRLTLHRLLRWSYREKKAWKHCVPMKRNSKRCSKNSKGCRKN